MFNTVSSLYTIACKRCQIQFMAYTKGAQMWFIDFKYNLDAVYSTSTRKKAQMEGDFSGWQSLWAKQITHPSRNI